MKASHTPEQIRQAIHDAGLTVNKVMIKAGTSGNTIWRWEQKRCEPQQETIDRIFAAVAELTA